jgi:hypothetical protein
MNGVAANPAQSLDIRLKPFLTISGICHAGLIVLMAVSGYLHFFPRQPVGCRRGWQQRRQGYARQWKHRHAAAARCFGER